MKRRVVITGIGIISSIGSSRDRFLQNLLEQRSYIRPVPERFEANYHFKSRFYSPLNKIEPSDFGINSSLVNFMQEADKTSIVCAKMALEDAGFNLIENDNYFQIKGLNDCGVIMGVGISGLESAFKSYLAHVAPDKDRLSKELNAKIHYSRMIIPQTMPNSVSSWVSILFRLHGENYTLNNACSSGTFAIGEAFRKIRGGYYDVLLSGGVENLHDEFGSIMRGFDMLGALTKSEDGRPVPFSYKRSGFLFSEGGGCVLVLEELLHARKRNAPIYAEILDFTANCDAYNIVQMDPSGRHIVRLLEGLKKDCRIDYINSHGTGTEQNDHIESMAIQKVFGGISSQPYINSTKGIVGHTIGASGAIEAAVTALSIRHSRIHGNKTPEPVDNLNLAMETMDLPVNYAVSVSYGFGGLNAGLLFRRLPNA